MRKDFDIITSTASICIFDPASLKHRLHEPPDWWADHFEEVNEINSGNMMVVGLGIDGKYKISILDELKKGISYVAAFIRCNSGEVFIGPGEDITGGELQPRDRTTTGIFIELKPSSYKVAILRFTFDHLGIVFEPVNQEAKNNLKSQLLI